MIYATCASFSRLLGGGSVKSRPASSASSLRASHASHLLLFSASASALVFSLFAQSNRAIVPLRPAIIMRAKIAADKPTMPMSLVNSPTVSTD